MQILKSILSCSNDVFKAEKFYSALSKGDLCYFKEFELSSQDYASDFISALKNELENKPLLKNSKSAFICFQTDNSVDFEQIYIAVDELVEIMGDIDVFFIEDSKQKVLKASIALTGIEI